MKIKNNNVLAQFGRKLRQYSIRWWQLLKQTSKNMIYSIVDKIEDITAEYYYVEFQFKKKDIGHFWMPLILKVRNENESEHIYQTILRLLDKNFIVSGVLPKKISKIQVDRKINFINEKLEEIGAYKHKIKIATFTQRHVGGKPIDTPNGTVPRDFVQREIKNEEFDIRILKADTRNLYQYDNYFVLELIEKDTQEE